MMNLGKFDQYDVALVSVLMYSSRESWLLSAVGAGIAPQRLRDLIEGLGRGAAHFLHEFRIIALKVLLEDLENAALVLQFRVLAGMGADQVADRGAEGLRMRRRILLARRLG